MHRRGQWPDLPGSCPVHRHTAPAATHLDRCSTPGCLLASARGPPSFGPRHVAANSGPRPPGRSLFFWSLWRGLPRACTLWAHAPRRATSWLRPEGLPASVPNGGTSPAPHFGSSTVERPAPPGGFPGSQGSPSFPRADIPDELRPGERRKRRDTALGTSHGCVRVRASSVATDSISPVLSSFASSVCFLFVCLGAEGGPSLGPTLVPLRRLGLGLDPEALGMVGPGDVA